MGLLKHLMFDDISSWTYGFYIGGEATFNAPARRGETVTVPGRNGTLFLDDGTYENITVEYKAFLAARTEEEFQQRLSQFRAALMSKRGYLRLSDTYHPEEFRLARYKSGLEIEPKQYNRVGGFKLEFDCKPQRYLKVGDLPVTFTDSYEFYANLKNPTLFPAGPLLMIYGYGDLLINDKAISVEDRTIGQIIFLGTARSDAALSLFSPFTHTTFIAGDIAETALTWQTTFPVSNAVQGTISVDPGDATLDDGLIITAIEISGENVTIGLQWPYATFEAGVASTVTKNAIIVVGYTNYTTQQPAQLTVTISETIDFLTNGVEMAAVSVSGALKTEETKIISTGTVNSSLSTLGNPLYIDCESGEAYKYEDGEKINVNSGVWLGEDLPRLEPGNNSIQQGEDMTRVDIVPRWWTL